MESLSVCPKERKIMHLAKDGQLDEALYLWYIQKRSQGIPVTGPIMTEKAQMFYQQLHVDDDFSLSFKASAGWLWRFCQRHGIRQLSLQGEKRSLISQI